MKNKRRIVVKIGSSSLHHENGGGLDYHRIDMLARELTDIRNGGGEVVLVSSGAIAVGRRAVVIDKRDREEDPISVKQACAAIGQARLMMTYEKAFAEYHQLTAQILLTKQTIVDDVSRVNACNTFSELLKLGVLPIVNENDTVATDEIEIGDNDSLSAIVAALIGADLLILFSDIDGLYTDDPHKNPDARFIGLVPELDERFFRMGKGTTGTGDGTGGMNTKLTAARIATSSGADMLIVNSKKIKSLHELLRGEEAGTLFLSRKDPAFDLVDFVKHMHK